MLRSEEAKENMKIEHTKNLICKNKGNANETRGVGVG
jgi:hypothetical protein